MTTIGKFLVMGSLCGWARACAGGGGGGNLYVSARSAFPTEYLLMVTLACLLFNRKSFAVYLFHMFMKTSIQPFRILLRLFAGRPPINISAAVS
jgi:hypothetical protein